MEEKMKKMLFLVLFLLILGAASVSAQVRIGGNGVPNGAAVLDLNATDAIDNGTKTLALPRVSLTSATDQLGYTTLLNGMLVYNTNTASGAGVYYWDTNKWVKVSGGEFVEGDGVIGNEISDTIANGGLTRSGAGTAESPYKVGVKAGGIQDGMIAVGDIDINKIRTTQADSGKPLMSNGTTAIFAYPYAAATVRTDTVYAYPHGTVTWTLISDTTVSYYQRPNAPTTFPRKGGQYGDWCVQVNGLPRAQLDWNRFTLYIFPFTFNSGGYEQTTRIRCYRPSL